MKKIFFLFLSLVFIFSCSVSNNSSKITVMNRTTKDFTNVKVGNNEIFSLKGKSNSESWFVSSFDGGITFKVTDENDTISTDSKYGFESGKNYIVKILKADNAVDMANILANEPQDMSIFTADNDYYVEIYEVN